MVTVCAMAAGDAEPTPVDPAGVVTRSVDEGSGFVSVQTAVEPSATPSRRERRGRAAVSLVAGRRRIVAGVA